MPTAIEIATAINAKIEADSNCGHTLLQVVPFAGKLIAVTSTRSGYGIPDAYFSSALRELDIPRAYRRRSSRTRTHNGDEEYASIYEVELEGHTITSAQPGWVSAQLGQFAGARLREGLGDILDFDRSLLNKLRDEGAFAANVGSLLFVASRNRIAEAIPNLSFVEPEGASSGSMDPQLCLSVWSIPTSSAVSAVWQLGVSQAFDYVSGAMHKLPDVAVAELLAAQLSTVEHLELLSILVDAKAHGRVYADALISRVCPHTIEMIDRTQEQQPSVIMAPQTATVSNYSYAEAC